MSGSNKLNPCALWHTPDSLPPCPEIMPTANFQEVLWAPDRLPLFTPGSPDPSFVARPLFEVCLSQFNS